MNLLNTLKILGKLLGYTLLYLFGKGEAMKAYEAAREKEALEEVTRVLEKNDEIRAKYDGARRAIPDDWDRVRKSAR